MFLTSDKSDQVLSTGHFDRRKFAKRIVQSTTFDIDATIEKKMALHSFNNAALDSKALFSKILGGQSVSKMKTNPPSKGGVGKLALHFSTNSPKPASKYKVVFRRSGQNRKSETVKFKNIKENESGDFQVITLPSGRYELVRIHFNDLVTPYAMYGEVDIRNGETTYGGEILLDSEGRRNDFFRVLVGNRFKAAKAELGDNIRLTYQNLFTEKTFNSQLEVFREKLRIESYQKFKAAQAKLEH